MYLLFCDVLSNMTHKITHSIRMKKLKCKYKLIDIILYHNIFFPLLLCCYNCRSECVHACVCACVHVCSREYACKTYILSDSSKFCDIRYAIRFCSDVNPYKKCLQILENVFFTIFLLYRQYI